MNIKIISLTAFIVGTLITGRKYYTTYQVTKR